MKTRISARSVIRMNVRLLVHDGATLSLPRGRLGRSGFGPLLSSSGGLRSQSRLLYGRKAEIQTAQQLGVHGDDDRRSTHEDGPHFWREGDAEGSKHPRSEGNGNKVVAGAPDQVLQHLPVTRP